MSRFSVWAPQIERVRVQVDGTDHDMTRDDNGWWTAEVKASSHSDYAFLLDDDPKPLPDPRSRWQPNGVHAASRRYVPADQDWPSSDWTGRQLAGGVVYELHIGTFTEEGTLAAAIGKLDHLVDLGVDFVELMPVNAFDGVEGWGYDGVAWYAVHEPYGGPDGFKRFVDACHARSLAVVLDVVYNHLGPSGNYLPRFGPYLKSGRNTWGELVNLEEPAVRRFVIDNALMWLRDFHVDALRLDAVHALEDSSPVHALAELSAEVEKLAAAVGRPLTLIAESDLNDPMMITNRPAGYGLDAQWDDDVHHALHSLLTGEQQGYYCDFGSLEVLAKVLTSAFLHDGTYSTFRGRNHGKPVDRANTPGWRFVVCLQNHDQVGNRAVGDRLTEITSLPRVQIGAVLLLTSAFTPMLWMGEEWAATTRWPFFTSHPEPGLAEATGKGRIEEFATHGWDVTAMIDPQDPAAYRTAALDWREPEQPEHAAVLSLYRELIALRAAIPDLRDSDLTKVAVDFDEQARWLVVHRGTVRVLVNLAAEAQAIRAPTGEILLATADVTPVDGGLVLAAQSAAIVRAE
jgi:maltooligosyltrehalose trehalohydrolase